MIACIGQLTWLSEWTHPAGAVHS